MGSEKKEDCISFSAAELGVVLGALNPEVQVESCGSAFSAFTALEGVALGLAGVPSVFGG